jgi:uncharacterized delta-60 repeat protein
MTNHFEGLECRRLLAAGDIDPTFGTNGQVAIDLARLTNHSLIEPAGNNQFFVFGSGLKKVDANGAPVTAFGQNGQAIAGYVPGQVLVQSDGKIVVLARNSATQEWAVLRLGSGGTLDTSFGQQGVANLKTLFNSSAADAITLQSTGKIVISAFNDISDSNDERRVVRLNANGTVDSTFHEYPFASATHETAMVTQSTDKLLIGGELFDGTREDEFDLVRLDADGNVDSSFGTNGRIATIEGPTDIQLIPGGGDGFVTVNSGHTLTKFSANGALDQNFGTNGKEFAKVGGSPLIQPADNGKWIVVSFFGLARLNADFMLDSTFAPLWADTETPNIVGAAVTSTGDILIGETTVGDASVGLQRVHGSAGGQSINTIALGNSTLSVTGTDNDEEIVVFPGYSDFPALVARVSGQFGKVFDISTVQHLTVLGNGGRDRIVLQGIDQPASVSGGDAKDTITGGNGDDSLSGNAGPDVILGGGGNDRLAGNGGRDRILGQDGDDRLYGGAGGDFLYGQMGNDILGGGSGDDRLEGDEGTDTMAGNDGDDRFFSKSDGNAESLFGDAGNDSALADANDILASIEGVIVP